MTCPHCGIGVEEHGAGRCLDAWVACTIFAKRVKDYGKFGWRCEDTADAVFRYSSDISCAWEIVKWFHNDNDCLSLAYVLQPHEGMKWEARFRIVDVWAIADTAPLAICRAALLAMEESCKSNS